MYIHAITVYKKYQNKNRYESLHYKNAIIAVMSMRKTLSAVLLNVMPVEG